MFTLTLSHDLSEFGIVDIVDVSWAEVGCGRHKFHVIFAASRPLL